MVETQVRVAVSDARKEGELVFVKYMGLTLRLRLPIDVAANTVVRVNVPHRATEMLTACNLIQRVVRRFLRSKDYRGPTTQMTAQMQWVVQNEQVFLEDYQQE